MKKTFALALIILMALNLTAFGKMSPSPGSLSLSGYTSSSGSSKNAGKAAKPPVLTVDETYFVDGVESQAVFTAESSSDTEVSLYYGSGRLAGKMKDQGTEGDEKAGDGIFTLSLAIGKDIKFSSSESFYAQAGSVKSSPVTLYTFARPKTEQEIQKHKKDFKEIQGGISEIEAKYYNDEGYVPKEKYPQLTKDILTYLEEHKGKEVLLYQAENEAVYIKYKSGIASVYEPYVPGTGGSGADGISLKFWVYQPCSDVIDLGYKDNTIFKVAGSLADRLRNCEPAGEYKGSQVTVETIRNLPSNAVIFWNGHGGYGPLVKSYLFTGEKFDLQRVFFDVTYEYACFTDQIVCSSTEAETNHIGVTGRFFQHNQMDLSNDLFLITSCYGLRDDRLANALIENGAETVLGFTDKVMLSYSIYIAIRTLNRMTAINMDSGEYYTVSEALEMAKEEFGSNDYVWYANTFPNDENKAVKAEPRILGNENYRLAAAPPEPVKELQGLWCTYSSISNMYYFEGEMVMFLENTDSGSSTDYKKNTYIKHELKRYTVQKLKPEEGTGYKVLIDGGPEFWTNEEYKDTLDRCWYDDKGNLQYSGSGSLWKITDCSIKDLTFEDEQ